MESPLSPKSVLSPPTGQIAAAPSPKPGAAVPIKSDDSPTRGADRRAERVERRKLSREESGYNGPERRTTVIDRRTGLERRRGAGIRRSDDRRGAEEGEMNTEQFEFIMAIETYKKVNKKMFPTWTEVLEVVQKLGYRKVTARTIKLENCPEPLPFDPDAPEQTTDEPAESLKRKSA